MVCQVGIQALSVMSRKAYYFSIILLLCLWDVYHVTVGKVWDIAAFVMMIAYFIRFPKIRSFSEKDLFLILSFGLAVIGLFSDPAAQAGITIGFVAYFFFREINQNLENVITALIFLFVSFQILDAVAFFGFGHVLQFYPDWFLAKRNYDGGEFFRPTGVFAEANALAVTMLVLFSMISTRAGIYFYTKLVVILSLAFSFSLFGLGSAVVLLIYSIYESRSIQFKVFIIIAISSSLFFLHGYEMPYIDIFVDRLADIKSDPSFVARFNLLAEYGIDVLLPSGYLTNPEVMNYHAANQALSIFYASGMLFPFVVFGYLYLAPDLRRLIIYGLLLIANPLFTTALFWCMLGYNRSMKAHGKRIYK